MRRECWERYPHYDFQGKPLLSDPDMKKSYRKYLTETFALPQENMKDRNSAITIYD